MKILKIFYSLFIVSALIFSSCSGSETNDTSTEKSTEEQIDTISLTDEIPDKVEEDKNDEKPIKKSSGKPDQTKKEATQKPIDEPSDDQDQIKKESAKKPETVKANNYSFIIADKGVPVSDNFKGDLMTSASEEVYIEKKGKCSNEDCGKKIVLVNMNQDKSIEITVGIVWKENDKKINKKRRYKLNKGQKLEVGCSSRCDENNTPVKWQIIGALYSD